jgi:hypothetical protein
MIVIEGTVKNGQVVLDEPDRLSEGTRVDVMPVGTRPIRSEAEEGPMTPEEIEAALAVMNRSEPLLLTPEEEALWKADLEAQRDYDRSAFAERAEKLQGMWE